MKEIEELEKRMALVLSISAAIDQLFVKEHKNRIRIHIANQLVMDKLGLATSNRVCLSIRETLIAKGAKRVIIRGNRFYEGIKPRSTV